MKFIFSLFLLFSFNVSFSWTEINGNIRGLVSNLESGQVIRGATIKLIPFSGKGEELKSFSLDAGEFIFSNIKPGLYNLECTAFGFKTSRIVGLQVREDRTKLAYFKLVRGPAAEITEIYTYAALEAKQQAAIETGSATKESIEDAPAMIYVINSEDIEANGYMGLNELLADIPEFEIQTRYAAGDYNTISSRGIHGNEKILILIDGVRCNSMVSSKSAIVENYNIRYADRVEVILGPASALYGADAYMGVVNIITKKDPNADGFSLTTSYGLYHTTSNAFQFGIGNEKISFSMSGGFHYSNGAPLNEIYGDEFRFYNNNYLKNGQIITSPFDSTGTTQTIEVKPFDLNRFSYFIQGKLKLKKLSIGFFHNQEQHNSAIGSLPQYAPYWADSKYGNALTGIHIDHIFTPKKSKKWSLKSQLNGTLMFITTNTKLVNTFSRYENAYKLGTDGGLRLTEIFNYKINKTHRFAIGLNLQHSMTIPKTSDIPAQRDRIAFPFRGINSVEENIYYLGTNYVDSDSNSLKVYQDIYQMRRLIGGLFAEYKLNIKDKLLLTLGLRYDQIIDISEYSPNKESRIYNSFNPRIGLVYKPSSNFNVKFFYGEGFLQPSPQRKYDHFGSFGPVTDADGNFTHIRGGFWRVPNEDLEPEKVRSAESSLSYTKGDFIIRANSYCNFIENSFVFERNFNNQTFNGIPVEGTEKAVNSTMPTWVFGATLRADYRFIFGKKEQIKLKLHASYTFTDGLINELENLPFTARNTIKAGLLLNLYNFSLSNRFTFRSTTYNEGGIDSDGNFVQKSNIPFAVWNLFAQYKMLKTKKIKLNFFVKVNNVLNSQYYHTTDNSAISFGASPQDPIRFVGGLDVNFGG